LRESKNHIFLLDVLKLLPFNFKLFLGGPENKSEIDIFEKLKDRVEFLDLNSRVQLEKKFVENIDQYMKLSDVYVFPSKSEGLGTPVLEAQACGIPVVTNLLKNVTDTEIIEGEGGFSSLLNADEFSNKIKLALKISHKKLILNAKYVGDRAGSDKIDEEYYRRIEGLVND